MKVATMYWLPKCTKYHTKQDLLKTSVLEQLFNYPCSRKRFETTDKDYFYLIKTLVEF